MASELVAARVVVHEIACGLWNRREYLFYRSLMKSISFVVARNIFVCAVLIESQPFSLSIF